MNPTLLPSLLSSTVLVRITGRDSAGIRKSYAPFFHHNAGITTLTCSGVVVPTTTNEKTTSGSTSTSPATPTSATTAASTSTSAATSTHHGTGSLPTLSTNDITPPTSTSPSSSHDEPMYIICSGSIITPFLTSHDTTSSHEYPITLLPDTNISILFESQHTSSWQSCTLVRLSHLPHVTRAITQLTQGSSGWCTGWSSSTASTSYTSASCVALLRIHAPYLKIPSWITAASTSRGCNITCIASPYGLLSPSVFHNSVVTGVISNMVGTMDTSSAPPLLLTDARILPGCEGGAVYDQHGHLLGIITLPLRHTDITSPVEFHLIITSDVLHTWLHRPKDVRMRTISTSSVAEKTTHTLFPLLKSPSIPISSPPAIPAALALAERSLVIARISVSWASAIILTHDGFILTNAHLIKPYVDTPETIPSTSTSIGIPSPHIGTNVGNIPLRTHVWIRIDAHHYAAASAYTNTASSWIKAQVVYISHGVWDVALLKIETSTPLHPIAFPIITPSSHPMHEPSLPVHTGQDIYVMGHALFAPPASLRPTVTRGTLSRIVSIPIESPPITSTSLSSSPLIPFPHHTHRIVPVLYQSSAAVHNGNSGGLLLDQNGIFLGMVTCNAQHTIQTVPIPSTSTSTSSIESPSPYTQTSDQPPATRYYEPDADVSQSPSTTSVILPHLNFSIPSSILLLLKLYCTSHDRSILSYLDNMDLVIARVWSLEHTLEPMMEPSLRFSDKYHALIQKLQKQEQDDKTRMINTVASHSVTVQKKQRYRKQPQSRL